MPVIYALLVGVNAYRDVATPLSGCRNDVSAVAAFLSNRIDSDTSVVIKELCDEQATRAAVIDGFRSHLGRAGKRDTALFWFSGHGSFAPVWEPLSYLEPSGHMQTLMCVDSRHGPVPDLYDKEIAVLTDEVAASGAHVVLVFDSCHSGGANRDALATRWTPPPAQPPPTDLLLPELIIRTPEGDPTGFYVGGADHVALAACRSDESATETLRYGPVHGLFTGALLAAAGQLGPGATYRELHTATRCEVENLVTRQVPQLDPANGTFADQPFLGGTIRPPGAGMTMRWVRGNWEVDAGACHGLPTVDPDRSLRLAVHGTDPAREAGVTQVLTERSLVIPIGWQPDPARQYPIVVSSVPLPQTTVAVGGVPDDPATVDRLLSALDTAGPAGGPSAYLRAVDPLTPGLEPQLRVRVPGPGRIRILGDDGVPITGDIDDSDGDPVERAVQALEHIARWRQLRSLTNPLSGLAGAVSMELVPTRPGDVVVPMHRPGLPAAPDGAVRLRYRLVQGRWSAPTVFVRIHNASDRPLYCTLLDLTDRFRVHSDLFSVQVIAAGGTAAALRGAPVGFTLPDNRKPVPGATARDWLKLLVAEEQFSAVPFAMPRLHDPWPATSRAPMALLGVIDRLGHRVVRRDAGPGAAAAHDWAVTTLPVVTEVPQTAKHGHH
ncbi:caspase family protein [Micromonospora sp. NBC_01796]|uniref:caspase family protein n=1 Tax=Micromonospora sp. NBC_01796 TaxID=2975987 RepID=UPI002DDBB0AA|nr:caspase family protein [Micromonospora sp. NBC_01796]WSA87929.1 caspase family protein [Micromonospora sp. NBC_01796]